MKMFAYAWLGKTLLIYIPLSKKKKGQRLQCSNYDLVWWTKGLIG